jgi:CRP/FNR family cyclic AMP-dependent transcriptional regulator
MDDETINALKAGWLGQVPSPLAKAFIDVGTFQTFPDGATVYGFGQEQCCLFGIASGHIRMWVTMNEQAPRFGHVAGPGFWFGESEVVTGQPRIMEMEASGETRLCMVARSDIDRIAKKHAETWASVALFAVMNQATAIGAADDLMLRNAKKRLVAVLLRLSSHRNAFQGVPPVSAVPVGQRELADAATLSRSSALAILAELSRDGLIRTDYRTIVILKPKQLGALLAD